MGVEGKEQVVALHHEERQHLEDILLKFGLGYGPSGAPGPFVKDGKGWESLSMLDS